jgi:hypothetical protein
VADPDRLRTDKERVERDRINSRLSWVAFILMALVGLLAIFYNRPVPAQSVPAPEFTRSL